MDDPRLDAWQTLKHLHPANRFRLMFGQPFLSMTKHIEGSPDYETPEERDAADWQRVTEADAGRDEGPWIPLTGPQLAWAEMEPSGQDAHEAACNFEENATKP